MCKENTLMARTGRAPGAKYLDWQGYPWATHGSLVVVLA